MKFDMLPAQFNFVSYCSDDEFDTSWVVYVVRNPCASKA